MNDDLHPSDAPGDDLLAVNALVDGTATAGDEALVEASAELRSLLADLRANRDLLRVVDVPTATREQAVAAALDEFELVHHGPDDSLAAATAASNVISFERRRRQYRVLTGAAAAVAVLLIGGVALNAGRGSDDEASVAVEAPTAKVGDSDGGVDQAADAATAIEAADAPADGAAPEATEAPAATQLASTPPEAASTIGAIPGPGEADVPDIGDEAALVAYAADRSPLVLTNGGGFSCAVADGTVLGQVVYAGRDAVVIRDEVSGTITAFDLTDCSVIVAVVP